VAPRATHFDVGVALLLIAALLSLLPSEYFRLSLRALRTLLLEPVLFFYLAVTLCPTVGALRPLWLALVGAASAVALLALAQVVGNVNTVEVEGVRRALGLYPSPNHLGLYLGRALPFALALAWWRPTWRAPLLIASAALALALAATFSVGAWLGSAAALCVLAALVGRRAFATVAGAGVLVAAAVMLIAARLGIERLQPGGATATFRQQIWTSSLAMLRDHPLLGIGLDNFLYRYQLQYILPAAWAEPNISHPHNWLLQFWLELGLLGLFAFLFLLARFIWLAHAVWLRPLAPEARALVAGAVASLAGLLVHGALDNSYFLVDLSILLCLHLAVVESCARPDAAASAADTGAVH
jgi:O-antigen ligase